MAYELEQFFAIRRHQPTLAFSPDDQHVYFSTDTSGQFNLWQVPVQGGWPEQRTLFEDRTVRAVASHAGSGSIVFLADRDGSEFWQLFTLPVRGGWPGVLTPRDDVRYHMPSRAFSPDGNLVAYSGNERTPTDVDVMVRDLRDGQARTVMATGEYLVPSCWSGEGRYLAVTAERSNIDTTVYMLDVETGTPVELTPHTEETLYVPVAWMAGGTLLLASNQGREFTGLAALDPRRPGELRWVYAPDWDIEEGDVDPEGRLAAVVVNEAGLSRLRLLDVEGGRVLQEHAVPAGVVSTVKLSHDGRQAALFIGTASRPPEVHVLDLTSGRLTRVTHSMLGGIPEDEMVQPELVHFQTFDGRHIPAWLYRPRGASPSSPAPVLLSIHGGPEAQERPVYSAFYQYLLSRGIGVLAPNIRGSTGYGLSYERLIHRDFGGGDLKDIEAAARYLHSLPWVNALRLGVYGGSYGGFATLSAVTRLPRYWAAAVDVVGPSNLVTFARSVPPTWRRFMKQWVGDPEEDREMLIERSPITYVDQVQAPLLVLQGQNDPRVVKAESDQMVQRLRELGKTVEYEVFEDEGHGFTRRANQLKAFRLAASFLERFLLAP